MLTARANGRAEIDTDKKSLSTKLRPFSKK